MKNNKIELYRIIIKQNLSNVNNSRNIHVEVSENEEADFRKKS